MWVEISKKMIRVYQTQVESVVKLTSSYEKMCYQLTLNRSRIKKKIIIVIIKDI